MSRRERHPGGTEPEEEVVQAEVVEEKPGPEELGLELPDDPAQAISLLLAEVAAARESAASHLEDLQRLAAEFDNYRKRMMRAQTQQVERASERVVMAMLPVLDSFDLALGHQPSTPSEQKLLDGVERTYRLLMEALRKEGLEPVPALGERFDPEVHQAVSAGEEPGEGPPVVTEELRRGYRLRDRVIRPALVEVGPESDASGGSARQNDE